MSLSTRAVGETVRKATTVFILIVSGVFVVFVGYSSVRNGRYGVPFGAFLVGVLLLLQLVLHCMDVRPGERQS